MTATASHTPGPWLLEPDHSEPCQLFLTTGRRDGPEWLRFATVVVRMEDEVSGDINNDPEGWANARLISAAPELYEALANLERRGLLKTLIDMDEAMDDDDGEEPIAKPHVELALAALAKARGEQP